MTNNLGLEESKDKELNELLVTLAAKTHGNECIEAVRAFFKALQKPKPIDVLKQLMHSEPMTWAEVGKHVWPIEQDREANRFPFLQGDLVASTKVLLPGVSPINQNHSLWLVKSPTCDAVRADYCQMAPVFKVYSSFKKGTPTEKKTYNDFRVASSFLSPNLFPVAYCDEDDDDHAGSYADFRIPGFLKLEDRADATVICSLTVEGWHLLNMFIQVRETRATMDEELAIRRSRSAAPQPDNVTPLRKSEGANH